MSLFDPTRSSLISIPSLHPQLPPNSYFAGIVNLIWPFSTGSGFPALTFKVTDPDPIKRLQKGEVKVRFVGPIAREVNGANVRIGDEVKIGLDGVEWFEVTTGGTSDVGWLLEVGRTGGKCELVRGSDVQHINVTEPLRIQEPAPPSLPDSQHEIPTEPSSPAAPSSYYTAPSELPAYRGSWSLPSSFKRKRIHRMSSDWVGNSDLEEGEDPKRLKIGLQSSPPPHHREEGMEMDEAEERADARSTQFTSDYATALESIPPSQDHRDFEDEEVGPEQSMRGDEEGQEVEIRESDAVSDSPINEEEQSDSAPVNPAPSHPQQINTEEFPAATGTTDFLAQDRGRPLILETDLPSPQATAFRRVSITSLGSNQSVQSQIFSPVIMRDFSTQTDELPVDNEPSSPVPEASTMQQLPSPAADVGPQREPVTVSSDSAPDEQGDVEGSEEEESQDIEERRMVSGKGSEEESEEDTLEAEEDDSLENEPVHSEDEVAVDKGAAVQQDFEREGSYHSQHSDESVADSHQNDEISGGENAAQTSVESTAGLDDKETLDEPESASEGHHVSDEPDHSVSESYYSEEESEGREAASGPVDVGVQDAHDMSDAAEISSQNHPYADEKLRLYNEADAEHAGENGDESEDYESSVDAGEGPSLQHIAHGHQVREKGRYDEIEDFYSDDYVCQEDGDPADDVKKEDASMHSGEDGYASVEVGGSIENAISISSDSSSYEKPPPSSPPPRPPVQCRRTISATAQADWDPHTQILPTNAPRNFSPARVEDWLNRSGGPTEDIEDPVSEYSDGIEQMQDHASLQGSRGLENASLEDDPLSDYSAEQEMGGYAQPQMLQNHQSAVLEDDYYSDFDEDDYPVRQEMEGHVQPQVSQNHQSAVLEDDYYSDFDDEYDYPADSPHVSESENGRAIRRVSPTLTPVRNTLPVVDLYHSPGLEDGEEEEDFRKKGPHETREGKEMEEEDFLDGHPHGIREDEEMEEEQDFRDRTPTRSSLTNRETAKEIFSPNTSDRSREPSTLSSRTPLMISTTNLNAGVAPDAAHRRESLPAYLQTPKAQITGSMGSAFGRFSEGIEKTATPLSDSFRRQKEPPSPSFQGTLAGTFARQQPHTPWTVPRGLGIPGEVTETALSTVFKRSTTAVGPASIRRGRTDVEKDLFAKPAVPQGRDPKTQSLPSTPTKKKDTIVSNEKVEKAEDGEKKEEEELKKVEHVDNTPKTNKPVSTPSTLQRQPSRRRDRRF